MTGLPSQKNAAVPRNSGMPRLPSIPSPEVDGPGHFPVLHFRPPPRTGDQGVYQHRPAGRDGVTTFPASTTQSVSGTRQPPEPDWQVLVLFEDDHDSVIKGIWGPYTSVDIAASALDELRQWPLDGVWDMRRLNKFVARKSGNEPDSLTRWTWSNG